MGAWLSRGTLAKFADALKVECRYIRGGLNIACLPGNLLHVFPEICLSWYSLIAVSAALPLSCAMNLIPNFNKFNFEFAAMPMSNSLVADGKRKNSFRKNFPAATKEFDIGIAANSKLNLLKLGIGFIKAETAIKLYQDKQISGIQLTEKLESIFKRDHSLEQTKKVLDACSPYKVTGHDSPVDVEGFLSDFRPLQGTVSTTYPPRNTYEIGSFGNCIGSLISGLKGGEEYVASFQQIWEHLSDHGGPKQLNYRPSKNISDKTTNNWKLFIKSTRPDNLVMFRGKVYFYGQEKEKAAEFERAKMEVSEKMVEMPPAMYGELKFVICYAAAAEYIQFFMLQLRKADGAPILTPVTDVLDMKKDKPKLVLYYIKLYFLLLGMDACGSDFKYKLHTEIQHGYSLITLTLDGAEKKIPDFEAFSKEFLVDFQDLVIAYDAASLCDGYLIGSVLGPRLQEEEVEVEVEVCVLETQVTSGKRKSDSTTTSSTATNSLNKKPKTTKKCLKRDTTRQTKTVKRKVYRVETAPLCAERAPASEDDLRAMAIAVLEALRVLHAAGLVHRDIRLSNVMYDYSEEKYVLIDLESVSKENLAPGFKFKCWKPKTLDRVGDQHQYTKLSDLYQLGVLLCDCGAVVVDGVFVFYHVAFEQGCQFDCTQSSG